MGRHRRVYKCITTTATRPRDRAVTWSHVVDAAFIKYKVPGSPASRYFSLFICFLFLSFFLPFFSIGHASYAGTKTNRNRYRAPGPYRVAATRIIPDHGIHITRRQYVTGNNRVFLDVDAWIDTGPGNDAFCVPF